MAGMVYLVGAGPGDYRLISLKAVDCLKKAEVVVYDRLADERILGWAPEDAERIYVGKASSHHTMRQEDISALLAAKAQEGKTVVRLKGGDPFVFGRGGEEALALVAAGIPFRVVPGITSGLGGLAMAGIPATTRDTNQAITLMTGHCATQGPEAVDWAAFARTKSPLILYMAMNNLPKIIPELIDAGMSPDTPVAFVTRASTPEQRVVVSTLQTALADVAASGIEAPAITVIGSIVPLRAALGFGDGRP